MVSLRDADLGRFSVEVELANNDDLALNRAGTLPDDQVRRMKVRGVVDSGAARLVLPEATARQLGLRTVGQTSVRYADHRTAQRNIAGDVELTYAGRSGVFHAIVEPSRNSALIGAIVMEDLDLIVDCTRQSLEPRDPRQIISEID